MQPQLPNLLNLPHVEIWITVLIGALCAGLALIVGRAMSDRRAWSKAVPVPKPDSGPRTDPFQQNSVWEKRSAARRGGQVIRVSLIESEHQAADGFEGWVLD